MPPTRGDPNALHDTRIIGCSTAYLIAPMVASPAPNECPVKTTSKKGFSVVKSSIRSFTLFSRPFEKYTSLRIGCTGTFCLG